MGDIFINYIPYIRVTATKKKKMIPETVPQILKVLNDRILLLLIEFIVKHAVLKSFSKDSKRYRLVQVSGRTGSSQPLQTLLMSSTANTSS